jgi:subtilisin family serine protease
MGSTAAAALDLTSLSGLMQLTRGSKDTVIGLIDGPVAIGHAEFGGMNETKPHGLMRGICARTDSSACLHGTFVAGILCARRGSLAPAICPNCTLLIRPVFTEITDGAVEGASAAPEELAAAIMECIEAGAHVLNLSLGLGRSSSRGQIALQRALDYAARRGAIIIAAAGNRGQIGASIITGHPWVIPVAACDSQGRPLTNTNLGHSIGRRGLRAPGGSIISLDPNGQTVALSGTSAAAPFVTGAIALLLSLFPAADGAMLRHVFLRAHSSGRRSVTPPLLDAWAAYRYADATFATQ